EKNALVEKYMTALNVRPADPDRPISNLSGGNQQKVLLGRWLATQPEVLILDEPTRGIDISAKTEIMEEVIALADEGVAVVFISSELDEVVRLSDRIVVLKDRRKLAELTADDALTSDSIIATIAEEPAAAPDSSQPAEDRKSTRLNSSHVSISYAVFCLKKKKKKQTNDRHTDQHKEPRELSPR